MHSLMYSLSHKHTHTNSSLSLSHILPLTHALTHTPSISHTQRSHCTQKRSHTQVTYNYIQRRRADEHPNNECQRGALATKIQAWRCVTGNTRPACGTTASDRDTHGRKWEGGGGGGGGEGERQRQGSEDDKPIKVWTINQSDKKPCCWTQEHEKPKTTRNQSAAF